MEARRTLALQALLLLAVAVATRAPLFGNPVIHSDEQFYLLVGDRMLSGSLPFVDIWDRKPFGLFVLYAAIRLAGGDGVLAYQFAATLAAAATALLVCRVAMRIATPAQATAAGALYLVWLVIYDGIGGQAPVFYNLPVAAAALLTARALDTHEPRQLVRDGGIAMALLGLAIQVKYTVVLEGAAFGLVWLWLLRRRGASIATLGGAGALWIAVALLPTIGVWTYYAANGHGAVFLHANLLSAFERGVDGSLPERLGLLAGGVAGIAPLLIVARRGARAAADPRRVLVRLLWGWAGVAFAAILLVGTYKLFYFLPLTLPAAILAARGLTRRLTAALLVGGAATAMALTAYRVARRGTAEQLAAIVRLVGPQPPGCLFVFGSEPVLYHLTRSCLPSRFLFRSHLGKTHEARALGVDPVAETRRILATCPSRIVFRTGKDDTNRATERVVLDALARHYERIGTVHLGAHDHSVYRMKPGACALHAP